MLEGFNGGQLSPALLLFPLLQIWFTRVTDGHAAKGALLETQSPQF